MRVLLVAVLLLAPLLVPGAQAILTRLTTTSPIVATAGVPFVVSGRFLVSSVGVPAQPVTVTVEGRPPVHLTTSTDGSFAMTTSIATVGLHRIDIVAAPGTEIEAAVVRTQRVAVLPAEPVALTTDVLTFRRHEFHWSPPLDDGGAPVFGYDVYRSKAGGGWTLLGGTNQARWFDLSVTPATSYEYQVYAKNGVGRGPASAPLAVTTPAEPEADALSAEFVTFLVCYDDRQQTCGMFGDGATVSSGSDWAFRIQAHFEGVASAGGRPLEGVTVGGRVDANLVPIFDNRGYAYAVKTDAAGRYKATPQPMQWAPPEGGCTTATWTMTATKSGLTAGDSATLTVCR